MSAQDANSNKHWLDHPKTPERVFRGLVAFCGLLVVVELIFFVLHYRHGHFAFDGWPGFFGVFGFLTFAGIVLSGKHIRKLLKRDEDYYDAP